MWSVRLWERVIRRLRRSGLWGEVERYVCESDDEEEESNEEVRMDDGTWQWPTPQ